MKLSYAQAIQFLYGLRLFGTTLGLENSERLAALAGNPQRGLRFIHVAGTNGKGSTCAILESIYRSAGLRVGLFTSPHLVSFRERIQVNRELVSQSKVVHLVERIRGWLPEFSPGRHPTFFEVVTAMALMHFDEQRCDLVIWETGLGGRLDATNIVKPLISIITNIQLDHEKWLGTTLPEIAREKAGIIKPGIPVLTGTDAPDAFQVISDTAARNGSALTRVVVPPVPPPLDHSHLPLLGAHQQQNAALAVTAVRILSPQIPIKESDLKAGLERVRWPGRLQVVRPHPGQIILLDGAHNPAGAESLRAALEELFPGQKPTLILGILRDKDWATMCRTLAPLVRRVLLAPVQSQRTTHPEELAPLLHEIAPEVEIQSCPSLGAAMALAKADSFVVLTGSLLFVGEAEELLSLMPSTSEERGLNEWAASGPKPLP